MNTPIRIGSLKSSHDSWYYGIKILYGQELLIRRTDDVWIIK